MNAGLSATAMERLPQHINMLNLKVQTTVQGLNHISTTKLRNSILTNISFHKSLNNWYL